MRCTTNTNQFYMSVMRLHIISRRNECVILCLHRFATQPLVFHSVKEYRFDISVFALANASYRNLHTVLDVCVGSWFLLH